MRSTTTTTTTTTLSLAIFAATSASAAVVVKRVPMWAQCGGIGYSGSTVCDAGSVCISNGPYYSQCLQGAIAPAPVTTSTAAATKPTSTEAPVVAATSSKAAVVAVPTSITTAPVSEAPTYTNNVCSGSLTKFTYFGVNQASAEFTPHALPGIRGIDYEWPSTVSIDSFLNKGFNTLRVPFLMERLSPNGMTGALDSTYLGSLKSIITHITSKGGFAVLDPHNYMRFNEQVISEANLAAWWKIVASEFKADKNVIFDVMNEPNGIDAQVVFSLNQAAVNAIRAAGATSQLILVEGTAWTGAHSWVSSGNAAAFANLKDPNSNVAIEMHQYLDPDSSGTQDYCPSASIGPEKISVATKWLQDNKQRGFMGEFGAGRSSTCIAAISNLLCAMAQADGVWIGATQWAAGPWWGNSYFMSLEGTSVPQVDAMVPYI